MRMIVTIAYYELVRLLHQRSVLLLLFLMPMVIIFILGTGLADFFSGGGTAINRVKLAVWTSGDQRLQEELELYTAKEVKGISVELVQASDAAHVTRLVEGQQADGGLIVPEQFRQQLLSGNDPTWEFIPGQSVRRLVVSQWAYSFFDKWSLETAAAAYSREHGHVDGGLTQAWSAANMEGHSYTFRETWRGYTATQYYGANMLVMFVLYAGMASAFSLVSAKEDHTLARLRSLPVPPWGIMAGKLLGQSLIGILQCGLIILCTSLFYGLGWGGRPLYLIAVCMLMLIFALGLAIIIGLLTKSRKTVMTIFQFIIITMTLLSGGFSPNIGELLARFSPFTASYWATQSILRMMLGSEGAYILQDILHLSIFTGVVLLVAAVVYRRVGYHE